MSLPTVSIVIPTYERPRQLALCLNALSALEYPRDRYQVIAVNDGSPKTTGIGKQLKQAFPHFELIHRPHGGPAAARNAGASAAEGEIIAFTDDDCLPEKNWLLEITDAVSGSPQSLVGGKIVNILSGNVFATASQLLIDFLYERCETSRAMQFFCASNLACRLDAFQQLGGFSEAFPIAAAEDRDFCRRWIKAGGALTYEPNAVVNHAHHMTARHFWKQHVNYGKGAFIFHDRYARDNGSHIKFERIKFYADLVCYPWQTVEENKLQLTALMLEAQLACASGFMTELLKLVFAPAKPLSSIRAIESDAPTLQASDH